MIYADWFTNLKPGVQAAFIIAVAAVVITLIVKDS